MRFDAQEGVDPRDDADGVAPQLVVLGVHDEDDRDDREEDAVDVDV